MDSSKKQQQGRQIGTKLLSHIENLAKAKHAKANHSQDKRRPKPQALRSGKEILRSPRLLTSPKSKPIPRMSACEDFALGLTRLLRYSLHCQTRIVVVFGDQVDHALPEVKINDTWYILDITFTTPKHPVKACDYTTYLFENRRDIYQKIRNITDYDTNEDLRIEHGFTKKG